jgi:hypothetical protein
MDRGYENERFESFKIKASVARKFRKYSREISKSQSMTLLLMLEFFENNGIVPTENFGPKMVTLESLIKKRVNGVIAILKDIEKTQTKPTAGMLSALLEQGEPKKKALMIEKKRTDTNNPIFDYRKMQR